MIRTITLRGVPERVARRIEERARRTGASLNRTVIEMLDEQVPAEPTVHHDADFLFGTWTAEEADEMERLLAEQRRVDPELWR